MFGKLGKKAENLGVKLELRSVLENNGPLDAIMYRLPEENFHTNSVLIVQPGEQAVFVKNGIIIANIQQSGRHVLKTANYPFLDQLRSILTGGVNSYTCQVYFVRSTTSVAQEWGSQLELRDPVWNIATKVGIGGSYRVRIADGPLFLTTLFGTGHTVITAQGLKDYFSQEIVMVAKSVITRAIRQSGSEILGVEASLDAFSAAIQPYVNEELMRHGITVDRFALDRISIIDSEARDYLEEHLSKAAVMRYMGDDWWKSELAQVFHEMAANTGTGGTIATLAGGIGAGTAMGNLMGRMIGTMPGFGPAAPTRQKTCAGCGAPVPDGSRFCPQCGNPIRDDKPQSQTSFCPQCGREIPADSVFGSFCGTKIRQ